MGEAAQYSIVWNEQGSPYTPSTEGIATECISTLWSSTPQSIRGILQGEIGTSMLLMLLNNIQTSFILLNKEFQLSGKRVESALAHLLLASWALIKISQK